MFTLISWSEHFANFASPHSGNIDLRTEDKWLAGNLFLVHSPKLYALIWMSYDKWWAWWKTSPTVVLDQYDFRTVVLRIFSPPFIEPACDVAFVLSIYLINIVTRSLSVFSPLLHCLWKGPYVKDLVLNKDLFGILGPYFHYFGFNHAENVNSVSYLQALVSGYTVGKFWFLPMLTDPCFGCWGWGVLIGS